MRESPRDAPSPHPSGPRKKPEGENRDLGPVPPQTLRFPALVPAIRAHVRRAFPNPSQDGYVDWSKVDVKDLEMPAGDDMGIVSDDEGIDVEEVKSESGFGTVIVVDNLPKVPDAKFEKLCTVVRKIYGQIGVVRENGLHMPKGADRQGHEGIAFVEFHNPAEAAAAIEQTNGYKLDKAHVFKVSKFDDFSKYDAVPDEYKAPEPKPYVRAREHRELHARRPRPRPVRPFDSETRRKCTGTTRR